jgi:hypothetical protein
MLLLFAYKSKPTKVTTLLLVPGEEAAVRARLVGEAIVARAEQALRDRRQSPLLESRIDLLGCEECILRMIERGKKAKTYVCLLFCV